jgi:hypothetical protein
VDSNLDPQIRAAAKSAKASLLKAYGPLGDAQRARIERGVDQVASLWRKSDGDLAAFVQRSFVADPGQLDLLFMRFQAAFEQLDGHMNEIARELRWSSDVDVGPLSAIDPILAGYDPAAHVVDDLFDNQLGFVALLNFPLTTLDERLADGKGYSRRRWAEVRLAGRFARRVPSAVDQRIARAASEGEMYINGYNLWMHHLLAEDGRRLFPKGLRLISHWNLRDQIRADYADRKDPDGLARQRLIATAMERIVTQTIPQAVIDNPRLDWDPAKNTVTVAPAAEVEEQSGAHSKAPLAADPKTEPDTRYAHLLANFRAQREADPYSPTAKTLIRRSFDLYREIPEERVVAMLTEICASPLAAQVGAVIEQRLGRKLVPHDLWYNGFQPRGAFTEKELDALTRKRYPTPAAFRADIPRILQALGFSPDKAAFLAAHILVDPARGAGHALQAARRGDFPHLRTRVEPGGMDYKGYNIAVHELGHNVEQVFSLYEVDHTLLSGVPNNAFTEALAFVFQGRDLFLLGKGPAKPDPEAERLRVLNDFYMTWEIAGVGLVDIATWHWMYDHPGATPAQLREAVVHIARDVWNRYYEKVLGGKDSVLLGVYSHMIQNTLYLPDYPIGHLIAFQIEEHLQKSGKGLGPEFERMARFGSVTPDLWMEHATGSPVSTAPLLKAAEAALSAASGANGQKDQK